MALFPCLSRKRPFQVLASRDLPGPGAVFDPLQNKSNLIVSLLTIIIVFGSELARHFGGPPGVFRGGLKIAFSSTDNEKRLS